MRIPPWSRKLLVGIVLVIGVHAYGLGMHIVLDRVTFEESGPASYVDDREHEWSAGGVWMENGDVLHIRFSATDDGTRYIGFGTVDFDNLGPITFDGTNAVPYFDDDGFGGDS